MRPETTALVEQPQFKVLKPERKMAAGPHTFVTVDVFSSERFLGDQLAIVSVRSDALSYEKKQQIAREFGYATTAFLHDTGPEGQARRVELFSPTEELRFAGHAILGVAHYIFQMLDGGAVISVETPDAEESFELNHSSFLTKAGLIQTHFDPERKVAAVEIPHDVHIHARETTKDEILAVQRSLITNPDTLKMKASHAIVSITRGLTFSLVDLTSSPSLLAELEPAEAPSPDLDAGWGVSPDQPSLSYCGCVYFVQLQTDFTEEPYITRLQVRVIEGGAEESGTASACCALAAHLALQKGGADSRHAYAIEQGLEMGRPSLLCVEVRLNEMGTGVSRITLSARAAFVMEGRLL